MAMPQLAEPLSLQWSDPEAVFATADSLISAGDLEQAASLYIHAAEFYEQRQDLRRSVVAYSALIQLQGATSPHRIRGAEVLAAMGHPNDAVSALESAAAAYLSGGLPDLALAARRSAAQIMPRADLWSTYVELCLRLGRQDQAIEQLQAVVSHAFTSHCTELFLPLAQRLLELQPGHVPTLRRMIRVYLERGDLNRAVETIRALLTERPNDADALERMAETFAALGNHPSAAEVTRRLACRFRGRGPEADEEAMRLLSRGLEWDPNNVELKRLRAQMERAHRQPQMASAAAEDYTAPIQLIEDDHTEPLHHGRCSMDIEARGTEAALDRYTDAGGNDPNFCMAAIGLG